MKFEVQHLSSYAYSKPICGSYNEVKLCPVSDDFQICYNFELQIDPPGASILRRLDFYTNQVHSFEMIEPHEHLKIISKSVVETLPDTRDFSVVADPAVLADLARQEWTYDFMSDSIHVPLIPMVIHEARELTSPITDVQRAVERIMAFIDAEFAYTPGATSIETPLTEVLEHRNGVCQDFAHVMIALCRAVDIPARYVTGYFWVDKTQQGTSEDNYATHAWVECFLPGIGWVGYDPTHNRRVSEIYIKVAVGRDYSDVKPISGTYRGKSTAVMDVAVEVQRI